MLIISLDQLNLLTHQLGIHVGFGHVELMLHQFFAGHAVCLGELAKLLGLGKVNLGKRNFHVLGIALFVIQNSQDRRRQEKIKN